MNARTIAGRALGLTLSLAVLGLGVALFASQFIAGWSGSRPNDGVTLFGIVGVAAGFVLLVRWARVVIGGAARARQSV